MKLISECTLKGVSKDPGGEGRVRVKGRRIVNGLNGFEI